MYYDEKMYGFNSGLSYYNYMMPEKAFRIQMLVYGLILFSLIVAASFFDQKPGGVKVLPVAKVSHEKQQS